MEHDEYLELKAQLISDLNGEYKLYANQYGLVKEIDKTYTQIKIKPYSFLMLIK